MTEETVPSRSGDRLAGALMIGAAVLSVAAMAHHPTGAAAQGGFTRFVHGTLIALTFVLLAGFARFSARRGWHSFAVMTGFILFAAGVFCVVIAGLINGFVVPELHEWGDVPPDIATLCWELNQTFAYASAFAMSGAFVLWGADLLRRGGPQDRWLGIAGLLAGAVPAALMASGLVNLHVAGALLVYSAQWAFSAGAGAWLLSRRD